MIPPVVTIDSLSELQDAVLADVRWYLDGRDGRAAYEAGHLPGAIWVDLENDLSRHDLPVTEGRHPLPTPEAFAAAMSALGIGDETIVVAYDDNGGMAAGRLVVMLRMLGRSAALLDGAFAGWVAAGRPVESGPSPQPRRSADDAQFTVTEWPRQRLASADETAEHAANGGAVLDSRPFERFTGEQSLIDPRPGHMPGARSAPWATLHAGDGRLRPRNELREHFLRLGVAEGAEGAGGAESADDTAITYCGSGVSSCLNVIAMEHAGLPPARLYIASWSGWAADPSRPAALGES